MHQSPGLAEGRLFGTHLSPLRRFGSGPLETAVATGVTRQLHGGPEPVLLTMLGGLFVRAPERLSDPSGADGYGYWPEVRAFQERAVEAVNLVICEFVLNEVVSAPVAVAEMVNVDLNEGRVHFHSMAGARELYSDRTIAPLSPDADVWFRAQPLAEGIVDRIDGVPLARALFSVAPTMPILVAGAYSHYSRQQLVEALLDSFVVVEQLVHQMWDAWPGTTTPQGPQKRPSGRRFDDIGYRIGKLRADNVLNTKDADVLETARDARNELAHGARVSEAAAIAGLEAMRLMLKNYLGVDVPAAVHVQGITW